MTDDYMAFLKAKVVLAEKQGIDISDDDINPILKDHQRVSVRWAASGGRRALFKAFGLGKTMDQLELVRIMREKVGGIGLITIPLGVRAEFFRDSRTLATGEHPMVSDAKRLELAKWLDGRPDRIVRPKFIRRTEEIDDPQGIYLTNYESVREGKLDPRVASVASLDEAAVLRGMGGVKTFREFMALFAGDRKTLGERVFSDPVKYRFVATALPAPNEYIELLAYSQFLGVMDTSQAKAQPMSSNILTPHGWKAMGEIKAGDKVITATGEPTDVLAVYPHGDRAIYRVTFSDGASVECTEDHLWLTTTLYERNNRRRYFQRNPDGKREFATVKTTGQILQTIDAGHQIPLVRPVQMPARELPVDPWLLGALIGNACMRETSIVFSSADEWTLGRVSDAVAKLGLFLRKNGADGVDWWITATGKQGGKGPNSNPLLSALRAIGLLGKRSWEKSIPEVYMLSSAEDRLEVLRGLMDTDGTVMRDGQSTFCTTSRLLCEQVRMLVLSLGGIASIREASRCSLTRHQAYIVDVRMADCPFSLPRKAERHRPRPKAMSRKIVGIEVLDCRPVQCIAVRHPSRLYVTDDYVLTHNTRFFKRDSTKADKLELHPHKEEEFWLWVSSWALFLQKPSDIGFSDAGYELPGLDVIWHELPSSPGQAGADKRGQNQLVRNVASGVVEASREKRESINARVARTAEIIENEQCDTGNQAVVWVNLNDEQQAVERALNGIGVSCSSLSGNQALDDRESLMSQWRGRETTAFVSKPSMYGAGANLQQSHVMVFAGIGYKFHDVFQAVHRELRFGQQQRVRAHFVYTEAERPIRAELERRWEQYRTMVANMTEIIKKYGLSHAEMAREMTRAIGVERIEVSGERYRIVNNDCVDETRRMDENSVGLILTSIPFSSQYEYSPNFADFGHSDTNEHFWAQMDFLIPELFRVLQPGRIAAIHVKDRIVPGGLNGHGFQTVYPFHVDAIQHFTKAGFAYMGMKTIVTDVVRENNQTYRLGWTEQCKDGTKMGVGMPEYLLLFRKPPSSGENSYADVPVEKLKPDCVGPDGCAMPWVRGGDEIMGTGYSRARWQVDAHGFTRDGGNRLLMPEELKALDHQSIFRMFRKYSLEQVYNIEHHVRIGEHLDAMGKLPVTFMLLQPQSWSPEVWTDVTRMLTLNSTQHAKGREMHLCLARGSRVLTKERGYIPIEEVTVGENVLTHRGRWRPVRIVRMTGVQRAITLRAQGVPGLTLTPDHKLWTRMARGQRARELAERSEPCWVESQQTLSAYVNLKLPDMEESDGDETLWWTVGRWLADGHIDAHGGVVISCGPSKWDRFVEMIGRFGGNTPFNGTAKQLQLRDPDRELRSILARCGSGAGGKHLPPEAFTLPVKLAGALLDGYLAGDGHYVPERSGWQATSISRDLLLGIALVVQRVHGAIASIHDGRGDREHVIEGRKVHARQEWNLNFSLSDGRKRPFILEDGAWKKVRSISEAGEVETWCLRVEEDESFTAEGCVVKNCPMQFDLADRVITQFSMKGETVYDPFGGLMTVPYRAILAGRYGVASELSASYFADGAMYCRAAEDRVMMPSLFDLLEAEERQPNDLEEVS